MEKIEFKRISKSIERDLNYYMKEYDLNQKEAYELLYKKYYIAMRLTQNYVEIEAREKIHNSFKEEKKWVIKDIYQAKTEGQKKQ